MRLSPTLHLSIAKTAQVQYGHFVVPPVALDAFTLIGSEDDCPRSVFTDKKVEPVDAYEPRRDETPEDQQQH